MLKQLQLLPCLAAVAAAAALAVAKFQLLQLEPGACQRYLHHSALKPFQTTPYLQSPVPEQMWESAVNLDLTLTQRNACELDGEDPIDAAPVHEGGAFAASVAAAA